MEKISATLDKVYDGSFLSSGESLVWFVNHEDLIVGEILRVRSVKQK